ncbi:MAG TPA: hypothetical protein VMF69_23095 [Gemmataceae bacterium]|nr:hypothetical protein [Gemmataceae bacterium]
MNLPSLPPDAEMQPLDPIQPNVEPPPSAAIRRSPLSPVRTRYWQWYNQEKAADIPAPGPRKRLLELTPLTVSRSRRHKRYGRRAMLWVLFWYVAFQMVPTLLKDRWQRIGPHYESRKWPELEQLAAEDPNRPLLVMVGSSRTAWAFQASALDGVPDSDGRPMLVYNFGVPSTGPCFQLFCLRDMLAKGIRPRFLLIEFLPALLCEGRRGVMREDGMLEFESLSVHRMLQWMPYLRNPKKWINLWFEARIAPCYTFRHYLITELKCLATGEPMPKHAPIDNRGWHVALPGPLPPAQHEDLMRAARMGYGPGLMEFHLGKTQYRAIHELLDLCRREKIPSTLVMMPEDSNFRSWYSPEAKTAVRNLLAELKQTYGVEVIDAQYWLPDYDFEDGHHALLHGSGVFTYRLRDELARVFAQSKAAK